MRIDRSVARSVAVAVVAGVLALVAALVISRQSILDAALLALVVAVGAEAAQLVYGLVRALRTPPTVGAAGSVVGAVGVVKEADGDRAQVLAEGARWQAVSAMPLMTGMRVKVVGLDGVRVIVEPVADTWPLRG